MRVRIARKAFADIEAIGDWIAESNQMRAETFMRELYDRCGSLADQPKRFPVAYAVRGRTIRKLTHGDYLIFYYLRDDQVEVVRVVHGSRDWLTLLEALG